MTPMDAMQDHAPVITLDGRHWHSLDSLQWHWGGAYKIIFTGYACVAQRRDRDDAGELIADTAEDLHDLIVADYAEQSVS